MDKKTQIRNDFNSLIRRYKFLDSKDLQNLANSTDEQYLIVYCNAIINIQKVGFCDFPWTYFNAIGMANINKTLDSFVLNNTHCEKREYYDGQCRTIFSNDKQKIDDQYKAIMKCRRNNLSERTEAFFKQTFKDFSDKQDIEHSDLPTIEYISYLNNVTIPQCVSTRILTSARENLFTPSEIEELIEICQKIKSGQKYIIHANRSSINYRIGGMFNNIPKTLRRYILNKEDGFIELDLKSAHLSFLCARMNIKLPNDVVYLIANETGLLKDRVKECIVTTIYGGTSSPRDALILDEARRELHNSGRLNRHAQPTQEQERADYAKLLGNAHYQAIRSATEAFKKEIELSNGVTDAFGKFIPWKVDLDDPCPASDINTITAAYYSSFEKKLMMKLIPITKKGFRIISDEHDGCTIYITNPNRKEEILKRCKNAVEKEAKRLGINTTLEIK